MIDRNGFVIEIRRGNGAPKYLALSPGAPVDPISVGLLGDFRLEADGVLDVHGYLYFDGASLFVQSTDGHHQIRVNGKPIGPDWTPVQPPCTLALGDARLVYCPASQASSVVAGASGGPTSARAAGRPPPPAFDESAPTMAHVRPDYDEALPTAKTRAPDEDATGSIPIPPAPHGLVAEDDNETTRALPLPVMSPNLGARAPAPAPPTAPVVAAAPPPPAPAPIAAPPTAPVVAAKPKPLDQLKEQWKAASPPKKAIALLLPVAFVMVIFGLDDPAPEPATATAPSASASTKTKTKATATTNKPTATEDPEDLDPPKPTATAAPTPTASSKKAPPPPPPEPTVVAAKENKEKTPERAAVDAVAAGAWEPAAKAYDELAKQHPENPAFREAARILRAKAKK